LRPRKAVKFNLGQRNGEPHFLMSKHEGDLGRVTNRDDLRLVNVTGENPDEPRAWLMLSLSDARNMHLPNSLGTEAED